MPSPSMFPPERSREVVPVPHTGGPPAVPDKEELPRCRECLSLGLARDAARRTGADAEAAALLDRLVAHYDATHG
ncbi:hypothetical protein [Streptomyces sp. UNOC14_S4]|uniref:hypothetical protein n=1 Tax=Streptomyces sp. UNOC14_S4 TaxID=2872340 RepID=UPI001E6183F2|nr:hypothetical protein [Streptomyces sp. UNOC14_S4]MCC3771365.1 hypothetical protein [Streptomyces sp. UNOC14_S4]